ncbi:MAG: 2Fe-2S iron-sulfur cluster-binding protein [Elusimicrobiota bacterium]
MPRVTIDGIDLDAERHWTVLDAARFLGLEIPTLCHEDGLSPFGGCRLCVVETGVGKRARLVTACTYPVEEGLNVRTNSRWVLRTRRMIVELLLSVCPSSKTIQDLAAKFGVQEVRFRQKHEDCILCGLCVRMCEEQMMAGAIGFVGRGQERRITTPFGAKSDVCRHCGGCMYICPVCNSRCQGPEAANAVCGNCAPLQPTCADLHEDYQCYMGPTGSCGTCVREKEGGRQKETTPPGKTSGKEQKEEVISGG